MGRSPVNGSYKLLPPDGHLAVPTTSRRAAKAGLTLYTACRRSSLVAQRAAWHAVTVAGPWVLPGRRQPWRPPIEASAWHELVASWRRDLGPFNDVALHLRRPAHRAGAALLLLRNGSPIAFVKLRAERPEQLETERRALAALERTNTWFATPRVLASGSVGRWHHLALSPLPVSIHTMVSDPPLPRIVDDIARALVPALPRPVDAGPDWRPMHGDLTPWNLRALDPATCVLFDWESASWAPPGADLLWYDAVVDVKELSVPRSGVEHGVQVKQYWIERLERTVAPGERSLAATVMRRLRNRGAV